MGIPLQREFELVIMVKVRIEEMLGRTEADRQITSEPLVVEREVKGTNESTPESRGRSLFKKNLTGPTLLEMPGYPARQIKK